MSKTNLDLEDILTDKAFEEDLLEIPLSDRVFRAFLMIVFIAIAVALVQLANLGILRSDFYGKRALINASEIKIEPAPRGIIFDRFKNPLLKNESAFNAFLAPNELPKELNDRLTVFREISKILAINEDDLNKKIAEKDWSLNENLLLSDNLSHDELVALASENIPGIKLEPAFQRIHEPSFKFAHLLGYTGLVSDTDLKQNSGLEINDVVGRVGLEAYYDNFLRGKNGREIFLRDAKGRIKDKERGELSEVGNSMDTFIDKDFQEYFYDRLEEALFALGRQIGVGMAINPQNGEVLALFNIPSFDAQKVSEYLNEANKPLFNRAISGLYTPGSTIKPLVATAALAEGVIDTVKEIFSAGYIEVPNPYNPESPSRFLDWKPHGWVNLYSALARSSNVYFYEIGGGFQNQKGLGISKLEEWWRKFMLDQETKIDLMGEEFGFLPNPVWKEEKTASSWRLGDTYNVSIGQGDLLITPIELLNYIGAIANGGKFYQPRIMKDIKNSKGDIVLQSEPKVLQDISRDIYGVLGDVRRGMRDVVQKSYGTANVLSGLPIEVAAKTGSAQTDNNTKINAFFVGYAPYQDPQIAIVILVENAREGSLNVVPVAKDVLMWYYENRLKSNRE